MTGTFSICSPLTVSTAVINLDCFCEPYIKWMVLSSCFSTALRRVKRKFLFLPTCTVAFSYSFNVNIRLDSSFGTAIVNLPSLSVKTNPKVSFTSTSTSGSASPLGFTTFPRTTICFLLWANPSKK